VAANLYLNLQGREFNAQMAMGATFGGVEVRPMTPEERTGWQIEDGEVGAVATLYKIIGNNRFAYATDIGRAGGKRDQRLYDPEEKKVVKRGQPIAAANPPEQAAARARARVLINGAPLGVPIATFVASVQEVIPADADELTGGDVISGALEGGGRSVNTQTGEITEPEDVEELPWTPEQVSASGQSEINGQASEKAGDHPGPVLTPREIPAGAAAQAHPFVAAMQLALAAVNLWDREKVGPLAFGEFRGEKALMVMARAGHSVEAIVEAVKKAQPTRAE
jgi:hypothetical protein